MSCETDTRKLSDILPYIQPYCRSLPEEMGMDYGRRSYIEFVKRSGSLVKTLVYDLQEGVRDYPLLTPSGYKISRVNYVDIHGHRSLEPTYDRNSAPNFNRNFNGNISGSVLGTFGYGPNYWTVCGPWRFHLFGYDCLYLLKEPNADHEHALQISVSVFPTQEICEFDADFFDRWVEGITYGALAKAMMLVNTDWYDPRLAEVYNKKYIAEIQRARHKEDLNYSRGPMRMIARRFV